MEDKYLADQLNRIIVFALEHQEWRDGAIAILREVYERGKRDGMMQTIYPVHEMIYSITGE